MTVLNNLLPSDLSWPVTYDTEQDKAMQTLWQAEVTWRAFVGIVPSTPVLSTPQHTEEDEAA
jgi:hypothetical protein